MLRSFFIVLFFVLIISQCFAQGPCQGTPGDTTVNVPLISNSMEPACEPARIRVRDRTPVTIRVANVSPVEVCATSLKPPTLTAVTNPLESIINTITGYKSFDLAKNTTGRTDTLRSLIALEAPPVGVVPKKKTPDELALDLFLTLAGHVSDAANEVASKQNNWQKLYQQDTDNLIKYITADYRGPLYKKFDPNNDGELSIVRSHANFTSPSGASKDDPPSESDFAALQALIDQMKLLQPRLITSCTSTDPAKIPNTCDQSKLQTTAEIVDQANALLLILQDNFKTLQAAQSAVVASIAVLHKIKLDFDNRINTKVVEIVIPKPPSPPFLVQTIHLGTDYGATDTGTITCSTDTSPAVATTDAINFAVLYQNVPALTVSAGLLTTFLEKRIISTTQQLDADGKTVDNVFAVTDSARASVFPMAFLNYRFAPPILKTWWGEPNSELVITHNLSAGIGINSNTGTNQPEFFGGYALGFSRVLIHTGLHYGRTESLGGGFSLGKVPVGFSGSTAPIAWGYHPSFAIGFSVRIAPF